MNDQESRLAELLKAAVGEPPTRVTVEAVQRQRARRRATAAGAAAAIAVVAGISAGLSGQLGNPGPAVSPTVSAAPVPCRPGWSVAEGAVPTGDFEDRLIAIAGSDGGRPVGCRRPVARPEARVPAAGALGRPPVGVHRRSVPGRAASLAHQPGGSVLRRCVGGRVLRLYGATAARAAHRTLERQIMVAAADPCPHPVENSLAANPDLRCGTRPRRCVGAGHPRLELP